MYTPTQPPCLFCYRIPKHYFSMAQLHAYVTLDLFLFFVIHKLSDLSVASGFQMPGDKGYPETLRNRLGALTLPMPRLLSDAKIFEKSSKPCHVGIHWIALVEYSQMSTHIPGFQSLSRFFTSFCIGQISPQQQYKG